MTKCYHDCDEPLSIVGSMYLYVHVERLTELVSFLICKRLAIPAALGYDFRDKFVECIYWKTRSVELTDRLTVAMVWHYGKQQFVNTTGGNVLKRKGLICSKFWTTLPVNILPFCQDIILVQAKREKRFVLLPIIIPGSVWSVALLEELKLSSTTCRLALLQPILQEEKKTTSKNYIVAIAKRTSRFMLTANQKTGEMLDVTDTFEYRTDRCRTSPEKIQELPFLEVDAKCYDKTGEMLALLAHM